MLFDSPLGELTYDELNRFLQQGVTENQILDYKLRVVDDLEKSMVAFANTDGGLIVVGVKEDNKAPQTWPGVPRKELTDCWLENRCYSRVTPLLPYEYTEIPVKDCPENALVVIRVRPSRNRPHMVRERGIYVRTGAQDRVPDLPLLRWLLEPQRDVQESPIFKAKAAIQVGIGKRYEGGLLLTTIAFAPMVEQPPVILNDRAVRSIVSRISDVWTNEQPARNSDVVRWGFDPPTELRDRLSVHTSGLIEVEVLDAQGERLPLLDYFLRFARILQAVTDLYVSVWGYNGPVFAGFAYCQASFSGFSFAGLARGADLVELDKIHMVRKPITVSPFWKGYVEDVEQSPSLCYEVLETLMKSLARDLGYTGLDEYVERFAETVSSQVVSHQLTPS